MIADTADGATLEVRVSPGARRDGILGRHGNALKVAVRAPPEKGRANRELVRMLADAAGARPRDVEVVRGQAARDKTVLFRGLDGAALRTALEPFC